MDSKVEREPFQASVDLPSPGGRLIATLPAHRLEEVRSALLFATGFNRVLD
jgi:hypothetical protein